jgi:hypothetical protein
VNITRRILTGILVLGVAVGGCSAASRIGGLQPPKLKPASHAPKAVLPPGTVDVRKPRIELGAGIDLYGYRHEDYAKAAAAEIAYLQGLHANAVTISFPFFMHGGQARGVYGKTNKTPSPADLAALVKTAETAGLYVALRPLLANASLGEPRNLWKPVSMRAWFASYQRFLMPYAKMAQRDRVPKLFVGAEFQDFATSPRWNRLDRALHRVYKGTLAYANNGHLLHPDSGGRRAQISADAYPDMPQLGPHASVRRLTRAWEAWDRTMPRGTVLSEVGIAGVRGAYAKPWMIKWPAARIDGTVQANWFTAACRAAAATHMGGIYFWAIGFGAVQLGTPLSLKNQSAWEAGPGERAAAACFSQLRHG